MKYAIALALVMGVTSVSASPYFVGENLTPKNHVSLGFNDTPTKKDAATTAGKTSTAKTGNLVALELNAAYNITPSTPISVGIPFYFANKDAAGTTRNALGNVNLGAGWNTSFTSQDQAWTYGYALAADFYAPTSRKAEAAFLAVANPTTDLFKYNVKATSVVPTVGLFVSRDQLSAKFNAGVGYSYVQGTAIPDRNRFNIPLQVATSWKALPNLHVNVEYNGIIEDRETANANSTTAALSRLRHGISPSISGNYDAIIASAYATVPFDEPTREVTNVSFGVNAGYTF